MKLKCSTSKYYVPGFKRPVLTSLQEIMKVKTDHNSEGRVLHVGESSLLPHVPLRKGSATTGVPEKASPGNRNIWTGS